MHTLTSIQASAIRKADSICFDHSPADDAATTGNSHGQIRAITEGHRHGCEGQITLVVPIESSRMNNYGEARGPFVAFDMIGSAQHDVGWRTVCRQIKAGSRIAFVWTRDNGSEVTREAGLVIDMLDVKVQNGNVCNTYRVRTYVGHDNSARMVRVARRG